MGKIIYDHVGDKSLLNLCKVVRKIDQTPIPRPEAARQADIDERVKRYRRRPTRAHWNTGFLFGRALTDGDAIDDDLLDDDSLAE